MVNSKLMPEGAGWCAQSDKQLATADGRETSGNACEDLYHVGSVYMTLARMGSRP